MDTSVAAVAVSSSEEKKKDASPTPTYRDIALDVSPDGTACLDGTHVRVVADAGPEQEALS